MKRVDLSIVESSAKPGMCSFRLPGQEDSHTATDVRRALSSAGFKPGDRAVLIPEEYLEALEDMLPTARGVAEMMASVVHIDFDDDVWSGPHPAGNRLKQEIEAIDKARGE